MASKPWLGQDAIDASADAYARLQRAQIAEFTARLPEHASRYHWPKERVLAERERRLRELLAVAKTKSPWHARRLAHIEPSAFKESNLAALPIMTKGDLMANFDAILTTRNFSLADVQTHLSGLSGDAYFRGSYHAVSTSGSSGTKGIFVFDWDAWIEFGLSSARAVPLMGIVPASGERLASLTSSHAAQGTGAFTQSYAPWLRSVFDDFLHLPITLPMNEIVERLNAFQPTRISGFPSVIYQLCHAAAEGRLKIAPRSILVGAEPLFPEVRAALERAFATKVFNFYGCSEASCLAFSCPNGAGLHVSEDLIITEAVDTEGQPAAPGIRSAKVLLTCLFNPALPLIRYELTDRIKLLPVSAPCVCGSSFARIDDVEGRADDFFIYAGNIFVHPAVFAGVLGAEPGIAAYQVHQTVRGAHILLSSVGFLSTHRIADRLAGHLRQLGLGDPQISFERVGAIERGVSGKFRQFVRLV